MYTWDSKRASRYEAKRARTARERERTARRAALHPLMGLQSSLWEQQLGVPEREVRRHIRVGPNCYLCGEPAEGDCEECHRPVCWICGSWYSTIPDVGPYTCMFGDSCRSARYHRWYSTTCLIRGLLEGFDGYPAENLQLFVRDHLTLWQWAEDAGWWHAQSPQDKRELLRAVARAQKLLSPAGRVREGVS